MSTIEAVATTRFHVGLYCSDLARSTKFYKALFGNEPTKAFAEYVRFESVDPPLVLTLKSHQAKGNGPLNHVGIRLVSSTVLVDIQRRLEEAGISTLRQEGVECCYAKQTKFWVTDPDRVLWELYVLDEDIEHSGTDDVPHPENVAAEESLKATWEHRLSDPFPERLPFADRSLDEIQLSGTLNAMVGRAELLRRLCESRRVLRHGCQLVVLGLIGDKPYHDRLDLPGQASKCEYLPVESEPLQLAIEAGFQGVFYEKLHDVNCVGVPGIDLRSFRLVGLQEVAASCNEQVVLYKGPFASIEIQPGITCLRGERTTLPASIVDVLKAGLLANQFMFFARIASRSNESTSASCGGDSVQQTGLQQALPLTLSPSLQTLAIQAADPSQATRSVRVTVATRDLPISVAYYRELLGSEPQIESETAARFVAGVPSAQLVLKQAEVGHGGAINHFGLRLIEPDAVEKIQRRLEAAGIATSIETNSLCGYARQNKVWSTAPDGQAWEVYTLLEDVDPSRADCQTGCSSLTSPKNSLWTPTPQTRDVIHFGINAADLNKSVLFYRQLFGIEPAKHFGDYAKFEVESHALMFSLSQHPASNVSGCYEVELEVSKQQLHAIVERVKHLQQPSSSSPSQQFQRLVITDYDGITWRFSTASSFDGDSSESELAISFQSVQGAVWSHRLGDAIPAAIPHETGSVAEIRLSGTFNGNSSKDAMLSLLQECRRVVSTAGRVLVTGLASDRPFPGVPQFPAPAAQIERVPTLTEVTTALTEAGFSEVHCEKQSPVHCLDGRGTELLSIVVIASRNEVSAEARNAKPCCNS